MLDGVEGAEDDCCGPLAVAEAGVDDGELPVAPDPVAPDPNAELSPPTTEEMMSLCWSTGVRFPKLSAIESSQEAFVMARHSASIDRNRN